MCSELHVDYVSILEKFAAVHLSGEKRGTPWYGVSEGIRVPTGYEDFWKNCKKYLTMSDRSETLTKCVLEVKGYVFKACRQGGLCAGFAGA